MGNVRRDIGIGEGFLGEEMGRGFTRMGTDFWDPDEVGSSVGEAGYGVPLGILTHPTLRTLHSAP